MRSIVRGTNGVVIAQAARLGYLGGPDDDVLDMTYGRGLWWTRYRPKRLIAHDLKLDGRDFTQLPEADNSMAVTCFDPTYVTTGGDETSTTADFRDRFAMGVQGWSNGRDIMAGGLKEAARVTRPGGFVLVKCMDYTESGHKVWNLVWLVQTAEGLGLELHDRFIHHSGGGPRPKTNRDGSPRQQKHAWEVASFLCVFVKR